METRHLEFFVAVADELSFTRAARRVSAVQSTISAGVAALEKQIGTSLFVRSTRQVRLTPAGEELLPRARRVVAEVGAMRSIGDQTRKGLRGRIRVGVITAMAIDIPGILGRFHAAHPGVELSLSLSPRGSGGLLEEVRRGRLDVAWIGVGDDEPAITDLHVLPVETLTYSAFLPRSHPLARESGPISIEALLDEPHIDMPRGFGNRDQVDRWLAGHGLRRRVIAEIPDLQQIPAFVAAGLGIAVNLAHVGRDVPGVVARPVIPVLEWRLWLVAARRDRPPAVDALLRVAQAGIARDGIAQDRIAQDGAPTADR